MESRRNKPSLHEKVYILEMEKSSLKMLLDTIQNWRVAKHFECNIDFNQTNTYIISNRPYISLEVIFQSPYRKNIHHCCDLIQSIIALLKKCQHPFDMSIPSTICRRESALIDQSPTSESTANNSNVAVDQQRRRLSGRNNHRSSQQRCSHNCHRSHSIVSTSTTNNGNGGNVIYNHTLMGQYPTVADYYRDILANNSKFSCVKERDCGGLSGPDLGLKCVNNVK